MRNDVLMKEKIRQSLKIPQNGKAFNKRKIFLVLKTPPPYGGGEVRALALRDYVMNISDFIVLELNSEKRDKSSQAKFELWKISEFISHWLRFKRNLVIHRPALIFLSLPKSFLPFVRDSLFVWTASLFRIPSVGELAGMTFYFLHDNKLGCLYGKLVLSRMTCIRVLGKGVSNALMHYGIKNTIVSDNGVSVDPGLKYYSRSKDGIVRLLFVGTHSPQKGFDVLLIAVSDLIKKGYKIELHAIGQWISNSFQNKMNALIDYYGIKDKIVFHGLKMGQEKWHIYSESQMFVLPSLREGQPLTLLEALGCGMPVVATNVGAIPETIEDGKNGYLVSPGSVSQLSEAIERLIVSTQLRRKISNANIALFNKRFTSEKYLRTQVSWLRACAA